jgi:hypothetical protein
MPPFLRKEADVSEERALPPQPKRPVVANQPPPWPHKPIRPNGKRDAPQDGYEEITKE